MAEPEAPANPVADPAPLGLAAFALTTFLLSAKNAGFNSIGDAFIGYAFAYGGIVQLLAGMQEFRNRNVFGATAFSSYGAFWIGLWGYIQWVGKGAGTHDIGWILLAFAIFNTYMLIAATRVNMAVFLVFLTLEITEIVLFVGDFATNTNITKIGGYIGILTALVAWYTSFAGVGRSVGISMPVGSPMGNKAASI
jgi:succinate-acetate transporter protein